MKTYTQAEAIEIYTSVGTEFISQIARLHDLPELLTATPIHRPTKTNTDEPGSMEWNVKVTPRGQTSLFLNTLSVKVSLTLAKPLADGSPAHSLGADIQVSYDHADGGSNGYRLHYFVYFQPSPIKAKSEYLGYVSSSTEREIISRVHRAILAVEKAKAEAENGSKRLNPDIGQINSTSHKSEF